MTLAGIAYGHPADIPGYLDRDALTHGVWQAIWIAWAETVPVNFAYLTRNLRDGGYAVAIRGTYPNPFSPAYWEDGNQDSPFGPMAEWPSGVPGDPGGPNPQVSGGTWAGFSGLLALQDAAGTTLAQALDRLPADAPSRLPGTASAERSPRPGALAGRARSGPDRGRGDLRRHDARQRRVRRPVRSGDPLAGRVRRIYNTLDSVPYGWDDVLATCTFFQPAPQGGVLLDLALHAAAWRLRDYGYTAIGTPVPLPGRVAPPPIACTPIAFVIETLHQHMPDTYLGLLGAPPLPFRLGLGAVVAPIDHPVAALLAAHRVPPPISAEDSDARPVPHR